MWARRWACLPCVLIPGPAEPKSLRGYLRPLAESFQRLQQGIPMLVNIPASLLDKLRETDLQRCSPHPHARGIWQVPILHHGYLYDLAAYTPARIKLMNWGWWTSKVGACGWCATVGQVLAGTAVRFLGYARRMAIETPWRGARRTLTCHAWDDALQLSTEELDNRARGLDCRIPGECTGGFFACSLQ